VLKVLRNQSEISVKVHIGKRPRMQQPEQ
jgi:hypothetical protein